MYIWNNSVSVCFLLLLMIFSWVDLSCCSYCCCCGCFGCPLSGFHQSLKKEKCCVFASILMSHFVFFMYKKLEKDIIWVYLREKKKQIGRISCNIFVRNFMNLLILFFVICDIFKNDFGIWYYWAKRHGIMNLWEIV